MKNTLKLLVIALSILLIFTSIGIPVVAQEGVGEGTTTSSEDQALQVAGTNAAVPGGPGFIMVHPTAFVPFTSALEYSFSSGGYLYNPSSSPAYYEAAVNLPHGAKITKVVVYYKDESPGNLRASLAVVGMDTPGAWEMAVLSSEGSTAGFRVMEDTTITLDTVDNQSYAYWIEVYLPGGYQTLLTLRGIRIDYSYPVNLPLINR